MDPIRKHLQHEYVCGANKSTNIHWDIRPGSRACICGCEEAREAYDELLAYVSTLEDWLMQGYLPEGCTKEWLAGAPSRPKWLESQTERTSHDPS